MSTVARDLAATSALDDSGAAVSIGSFWTDRRAVVVMIRHFDSASCRKIVAAMRDAVPEIVKRGAGVVVGGAAPPETMKEFRESVGYRGPLVVDPTLDAFHAAGMVAGSAPKTAAGPAAAAPKPAPAPAPEPTGFFGRMKAALNADVGKLMKMDLTEALTTDLVKLGSQTGTAARSTAAASPTPTRAANHDAGVFVLGPGAASGFEWRSEKAGELPKLADLLAALPKK